MMKRRVIYAYTCLFIGLLLRAQVYNFSRYDEEKGLPQSYIYCISQSPQGYLVLSAGEAVCLFDGNVFTSVYNADMKENIVTTHFIDSRSTVWLGHQQQGLSYMTGKSPKRLNDTLLSGVKISQISEDASGSVWLAGSNGLYRIQNNFKVVKVPLPKEKAFSSITFDAHHNLLGGTTEGLFIASCNAAGKIISTKEIEALKDKNIKQVIAADGTGLNYWVLAEDVIYGLVYKNGAYKLVMPVAPGSGSESTSIACIYRDKSNNLWISRFGEGLTRIGFRGEPMKGNYSLSKINRDNGLKSHNIQSMFQDNEGNMWFGTFGEGLIKKPLEMFSFLGRGEGLAAYDVKKVIPDHTNLWMATNAGLALFNRSNGTYQVYNGANGFVNDKVTTLFKDNENKLWIGTETQGVYTFDLNTRRFGALPGKIKLPLGSVSCITQAGNKILVGHTDGLFICDRDLSWSEQITMNQGLLHNNVKHVFADSKNRIWISSHGAPPYYISLQKITPFKKMDGYSSYNITATCEDAKGNIWIATDGEGVFKYDNNKFYNYTTRQGLLSDYCNGIEADKNNSIWVTHNSGLSELKEGMRKFMPFNTRKGLMFTENNINAVYRDSASNLWFGTTQGVVEYNIESGRKPDSEIPEIFVSAVQLNKEYFDVNKPIEKKYGYYSVQINYKAISLSEPEAIYYKYRLMDVDTVWKITNMPYVDFPKLGDGDYTFEVMACNAGKGACSKTPASVSFTIQKPVWKHLWFYILIACLIIAIAYRIIIYRTRALVKAQVVLQHKVDEKTYLLKKEKEAVEVIKTDLEHKNKDITDSIHYARNIQDSLLPPEELMKDLFRDNAFVLYKPKDIVSGDFYWCSGNGATNGRALNMAAVVDCTGHGVPGAFLSILANNFLKQSVRESEMNMPNEILDQLNKSVSTHLNQHSTKSKIRDGMDIALVGINYTEKKLYYAGANNPIYVFRKKPDGIEEIIVKPTKQAIGSVNDVIIDYELQTIDLEEGDTVYLFSDGYADQFGGEKNKKLTYKRFREILGQAFLLPLHEQKPVIEKCLEAWKKDTEQTDDVCVMGIRFSSAD